jgi:nucleolar protein 12
MRAKSIKTKENGSLKPSLLGRGKTNKTGYNPKMSARDQSNIGRASKLLGRAGAAQLRSGSGPQKGMRRPESFIFEGHRATAKQGTTGLKFNRSSKKKVGKPTTRSAKRGTAWKKSGGKK